MNENSAWSTWSPMTHFLALMLAAIVGFATNLGTLDLCELAAAYSLPTWS
jgi:hypothetical protein